MASTFYKVPEQFGGKSLSQIQEQGLGNFGRVDILAPMLGIDPNQPLTAGQNLSFTLPEGVNPSGSAEVQGLRKFFEAGESPEQALQSQTRQREDEFLGRLQGIPDALSALRGELGVTDAQDIFRQAGEGLRNVTGQIRDVAPTQETIAKQVGISAPRLQQRIASQTAKLQPFAETATRGLEAAQQGLESVLGTYGTEAQGIVSALDVEAGLLGESIKNQYDLLKTQIQSETDKAIENLRQKGANDRAALERAQRAAEAEEAAQAGSLVSLGDRYALINPITGSIMDEYSIGLAPRRLGDGPDNNDPLNLG